MVAERCRPACLKSSTTVGSLLYVEVPAEAWRPAPGSRKLRAACLRLLLRNRPLLIAADVLCTASRIKLGRLPPLGFVAMREHLNYFTADAVVALLQRSGFTVDLSGINAAGQIFAVATKSPTGARARSSAALPPQSV